MEPFFTLSVPLICWFRNRALVKKYEREAPERREEVAVVHSCRAGDEEVGRGDEASWVQVRVRLVHLDGGGGGGDRGAGGVDDDGGDGGGDGDGGDGGDGGGGDDRDDDDDDACLVCVTCTFS